MTPHEPVVLPYWLASHLHGQTMSLMAAWIEWRTRGGFRPGTLCPRSSQPREDYWKIEEMGWAFLSLPSWQQEIIWTYYTTQVESWRTFRREMRLSSGRFRSILIELQDAARRRGLLEDEDLALVLERCPENAASYEERSTC